MSQLRRIRAISILTIVYLVLALSNSWAAEQLYTQQPTVTPELANAGQYSVGVKTIEIVNPGQLSAADFQSLSDRSLKLEIWYPAKTPNESEQASYQDVLRSGAAFELQGEAFRGAELIKPTLAKYPLIVLSHGYTGYRSLMFYLGEHLASHGYVVASIDHTDSTNAEIDYAKAPGAGFPSTLLNRAKDQQFVLDHLSSADNELSKAIDFTSAAVIGYSMGGYGALNTVGGCYAFSGEFIQSFGIPAETATALKPVFNTCNAGREKVDPRWKAMIAFAPWGGTQDLHQLQDIDLPSLLIAGNEDDVSGYANGVQKLFKQMPSTNSYMMVYENARHNIAGHPAPKIAYTSDLDIGHYFEPSWNSQTINRINKHMTLAFLDCQLKASESACNFLPSTEDITQRRQADGSLSAAWPGFAERWGTGVKFYRGKNTVQVKN